jgi:cytochrome P450
VSSGRERMGRALVRAQPWLLRRGDVIFRPLRRFKPVLRIKKAVVLTRHTDVRAVLERDDVFSVTYAAHMEAVTGPFILGWDDGPQYRHEVGALRDATPHDDLPRVATLTSERAADVLSGGGAVDGVALADEVVGAGLDRYFGLPELADAPMREAARDVFRAVFLDAETPATVQRGKEASGELVAAIATAMQRVRSAPDDTVVSRLVAAGTLDDDAIPRNLVGLVAAWAASVPRAFALALDVLLDRPPELRRLEALAASGDTRAVGTLLVEALRLQPQAPFLIRKARGPMVIAPGSDHEQHIAAGDVVVAVTQSAMRDRYVLDQPGALRTDRDPHEILHFGAGIHRCFGAAISVTQFGALGTELVKAGGVRRAGPLTWGPAFPQSLPLTVGA